MRELIGAALALIAAGCQRLPPPTPATLAAQLLDEDLPTAAKSTRLLPGVTRTEFLVARNQRELQRLESRLQLPALFGGKPTDFEAEMVVGAVDEPLPRRRAFHIYRVMYTPEAVEVQVVSLPGQEIHAPVTPYVFTRIPRSALPVRFYLNDRPAGGEGIPPLGPGLHDAMITYHMPYSLNIPAGLEAPAPLLVFLHSSTSNGHRWAPNFDILAAKYGFVVLTPTAHNGYYWTEAYDYQPILDAIEEVKLRYPIDPERIYLAGNSAGGHTAYRFGFEHREVFKALAASAGRLNPDIADDLLEQGRGMPVLILCGEQDTSVPIEQVRAGAERLRQHGVHATVRSYPTGHGVLAPGTGAFEDMFRWLSLQAYGTEEPRAAREPARVER